MRSIADAACLPPYHRDTILRGTKRYYHAEGIQALLSLSGENNHMSHIRELALSESGFKPMSLAEGSLQSDHDFGGACGGCFKIHRAIFFALAMDKLG